MGTRHNAGDNRAEFPQQGIRSDDDWARTSDVLCNFDNLGRK